MDHDLTTLDLAREVARAARGSSDDEEAAVAVLNVLFATNSWFCRMGEDERGCTVDTRYEQLDLLAEVGQRHVPPPGDRCGTNAETAWREQHDRGVVPGGGPGPEKRRGGGRTSTARGAAGRDKTGGGG